MSLLVVKVGGAFLDDQTISMPFFNALKHYQGKLKLVLVHGGGTTVERLLNDLQLKSEKINGLRVTPNSQIDYVVGVLAGTVNKKLCAQASTANIKAVGLSLFDGNMTIATQVNAELGNVGQVDPVDDSLLNTLLKGDFLPVINSIGVTSDGNLMNVNADQAAVIIAKLLGAKLALLSDVKGVLDEQKAVIDQLDSSSIKRLVTAGTIKEGMTVKVNAALDAANAIGQPVTIASWHDIDSLLANQTSTQSGCGTIIQPEFSMSAVNRKE